jgi:hypothetical protein
MTEPEDVELLESLVNHLDEDDVVFGCPRWLENFREMKQAAVDPLYKDSPKECTVLRFNLQLLMLKARHGWSDTGFNELLSLLATTYPMPNQVPANTYRAKKLIQLVAMKLRKFDACPSHCILYRGKEYENLTSYPHCGVSRYKRNAGCHVDADDERALWSGPKKKKGPRRALRRSRSHLSRTRKKRVTRRGKILLCRCGTCLSSITCGPNLGTPRMPS